MSRSQHSESELRELLDGYIASVLNGDRIVGKLERKAVERHVRDMERAEKGWKGFRFSEEAAFRALRVAADGYIYHTKGPCARKPFRFSRQSAWQIFVIWSLFGWQRFHSTYQRWVRRFTSAYVSMARKNGKTYLAGLIAIIGVAFDGEAGAEVYFAATKKDQAKIGWKQTAMIIKRCPDKDFRSMFRVVDSTARIVLNEDESVIAAVGKDADTLDGLDPHVVIVDELHAHRTRDTWDVFESGMGSRPQPLMFGITTAGSRTDGLCWELEIDAIKILEQAVEEDGTFAFICRMDEGDDPHAEESWRKANPNLGESVTIDKLRQDSRRAQNNVVYLNEFKRKRCNTWTSGLTAWLDQQLWTDCEKNVDWSTFKGKPCWVGVDLSKGGDLTAVVAVFKGQGESFYVKPKFWIPEETIEERTFKSKAPFDRWVEDGFVEASEGRVIDLEDVKRYILDLGKIYDLQQVGIDPAGAWWITSQLLNEGVDVEKVRQGYWLSGPFSHTENLIKDRTLIHDGDPCLSWQFGNVQVETNRQQFRKPCKTKSTNYIDGWVATTMAVGIAVAAEESYGGNLLLGEV